MGITNADYFERDKYMSVSRIKKLLKCELDGTKDWDNTTKSDALLVGSYVDAYVEGTLEQFKIDTPEIFTKKISLNENTVDMLLDIDECYITKTLKIKADKLSSVKKLHPECFTIEYNLKANFIKADEICEYMDNDATIQQFLSGDKQTIMTGEIEGVPFKMKMDAYSKGIVISDLKVMRTVTDSNGQFYDFISQWGYDIQLACYQEIVFQNTGDRLPCFIVALTKETPINSVIIEIPQNIMDMALYNVQSTIVDLYDVYTGNREPDGCGTCKTCIAERTETPIISMFDIVD